MRQLIGARGVAVTMLRPVGTVKIEGRRIDALAENGYIESGSPIVVTDVQDNQVKVRAAD
jgi:membrane-bound ClpP family serine protease